jgi:LytS/YehU family sensor histidine kinase
VPLEDELELVRQYLAVEQARFSDRLRPDITVDPTLLTAAVPSFAVQHLVENAIRHGIANRSDAGHITIRAARRGDALEIVVEDDGAGIAAGAANLDGHGIANTRERLRTLYGDRASLDVAAGDRGTRARLILPYREMVFEEANRAGA